MMMKELDLEKFIKRMRIQITLAMGLLSARQKQFVERSSRLLIHESSFSYENEEFLGINHLESSSNS